MRTSGFDTVSAAELDRKAIGGAGTSASRRLAPLAAGGFTLLQAKSVAMPDAGPTGRGIGMSGMTAGRTGCRAGAADARGDAAMGRIA